MQDFEFNTTPSVAVERGGAARLGARIAARGWAQVFIVTDPGVRQAGLLNGVLASCAAHGVVTTVYSDLEPDPPAHVIHAATAAARACGATAVLGLGGGSSMDVAKLVALLRGSQQSLEDAYGVDNAIGPRLPLVLVPTTSGTGSEVTPVSIVTTESGEKKGVVSRLLLPDLALLDAELTLGLPAAVTAATGIDAMVHAIEAYTSHRLKNPVSDCLAREALRLLSGAIHQACRDGADLAAREQMLLGACLAGMAFANAPVAAVHALAYPLGARFHIPHGLSNALMLAPVIRFNASAAAPLYRELAAIVCPGAQGDEARQAAHLADHLAALPVSLGLPTRLRDVGIGEGDLVALASDAMLQTRLLVNNPRPLGLEDALALYRSAW